MRCWTLVHMRSHHIQLLHITTLALLVRLLLWTLAQQLVDMDACASASRRPRRFDVRAIDGPWPYKWLLAVYALLMYCSEGILHFHACRRGYFSFSECSSDLTCVCPVPCRRAVPARAGERAGPHGQLPGGAACVERRRRQPAASRYPWQHQQHCCVAEFLVHVVEHGPRGSPCHLSFCACQQPKA